MISHNLLWYERDMIIIDDYNWITTGVLFCIDAIVLLE